MSNSADFPKKHPESSDSSELAPLSVTGITAVTVGTIIWTIAFVLALVTHNWLAEHGRSDWIWIAAAGTGLGLLGMRYTRRRAIRIGEVTHE